MAVTGRPHVTPPAPLLTIAEALEILRCSESHLRREIRRGNLRARKVGALIRFTAQDLHDYVNRLVA